MCLVRVHQTSTRTDFPILSTTTPTTPVRRRCLTDNYTRSRDLGCCKRTRKMLRKAKPGMLRLIIQTKRKYKKNNNEETGRRETRDTEISEETREEIRSNATKTGAFHSTAMNKAQQAMKTILKTGLNTLQKARKKLFKKTLTYGTTNWIETPKKLRWRQAQRIATTKEIWTTKAAEWNPGLDKSTKTQKKAGGPTKRWEDDLNDFVKDEATGATQSNDLKNDTARLAAATNADDWKNREREQYMIQATSGQRFRSMTRRQQSHHDAMTTQSSSLHFYILRRTPYAV